MVMGVLREAIGLLEIIPDLARYGQHLAPQDGHVSALDEGNMFAADLLIIGVTELRHSLHTERSDLPRRDRAAAGHLDPARQTQPVLSDRLGSHLGAVQALHARFILHRTEGERVGSRSARGGSSESL